MNAPTYELGDWFSNNIPNWEAWLAEFVGRPIRALEIGTCEGRSARWLLEHVLTHRNAYLECVDLEIRTRLRANLAHWIQHPVDSWSQVMLHEMGSSFFWQHPRARACQFHVIYLDGSHHARSVLEDAVNAWRCLAYGGVLIFDDYLLCEDPLAPWDRPGPAIDAFLSAYRRELEVLPDVPHAINPGWQKAVRKRA